MVSIKGGRSGNSGGAVAPSAFWLFPWLFFALCCITPAHASDQILYRVNVGGPALAGSPAWSADTQASPSPYVNWAESGNETFDVTGNGTIDPPIDIGHVSIPEGTPEEVFHSDRWDPAIPAAAMTWTFPVEADARYLVRLYFAEFWIEAGDVGSRVFDVAINGQQVLDDYDAFERVGMGAGIVEAFSVGGAEEIVIEFLRQMEAPAIKGIEIVRADLDASPASVDFGDVEMGSTAQRLVRLTNTTEALITIDSQSLGGDEGFGSNLDLDTPLEIAPGAVVDFEVGFAPDAPDRFVARLDLFHDGPLGSTSVLLVGRAPERIEPLFRVNAGGARIFNPPWSGDPAGEPVPYVDATDTDTSSTSASIDLSNPSIPRGTPESVFQKERWLQSPSGTMTWTFPVAPSEYLVRLYFAEIFTGITGPGQRVFDVAINGEVVLKHFDQFAEAGLEAGIVKSFPVAIEATGGDERIVVELIRGPVENPAIKGLEIIPLPQLAISPMAHDFAGVRAGERGMQAFTLTNVGLESSRLVLTDLGIDGDDAFVFDANASECEPGLELAGGQTCELIAIFAPQARALFTATLDAASDSGGNVSAALAGTGIAPVLSADPAAAEFGQVVSRDTALVTITLANTGDDDLVFGTSEIFGDNPEHFGVEADGCSGQALAPETSCHVELSFTPQAPGEFLARLDLPSDAFAGPAFITLSGEGIKAQATVMLDNLQQTFDGNPKEVTVTTDPDGLSLVVTYDGDSAPPSAAGDYEIIATIDDPDWQGQATGTLVVEKASQSIGFDPIADRSADDPLAFALDATADSSLTVAFAVLSGPASVAGATLTLTGQAGTVTVEASQPGNANWLAADPVRQAFEITAGAAAGITVNDGDNQVGTPGVPLAVSPSVIVRDQRANPVSGVTVGFEVLSGGGSSSGNLQVTDAAGIARVGAWRLGDEPGDQQLGAEASGLVGSPVVFTARAGNWVDLAILIEPVSAFVGQGNRGQYLVMVMNSGPVDVNDAIVVSLMGEGMGDIEWTCAAETGANCVRSGTGDLAQSVDLMSGTSVIFLVAATLADAGDDEEVTSTVSVSAPEGVSDPNEDNDLDEIVTRSGIFADGFEILPVL